ncbi:putative quinol monooxygenase [Mannheimia granulomatis]|uniref:putative quinol monooxygenase n=1 Tax=Mannheimia granulomatis TaxID=85402 RepID=UPI0004789069|nr:putative quinol monooxygenase [Mannheimia granulomatis]QLB18206.1 antibiotic biosynthesis monooxygenase [Mannheimia granulomatis]
MLAVYAKCVVKPEKVAQFKRIIAPLIEQSRQESGCVSYQCGQVQGQENTFAFVELWQSQADLDAHLDQPHFQSAAQAFGDVLAKELDIELVECD